MPRIQNQFMAKFATWKRLKDDGIEAIVGTTDSDNGKYCISPDPPELQIINSNENNRGKYICHLSDGIEERIADVFLGKFCYFLNFAQSYHWKANIVSI